MSSIIIPEQSQIKAIEESKNYSGETSPIIDGITGKPLSSKDIHSLQEKRVTYKHSLPIGGGWIYYKFKLPETDNWFVGKVFKRNIPTGAIAIGYKKAIEMMYGKVIAENKANQDKWNKIRDDAEGEIVVYTEEILYTDLPNPNNELENQTLHDVAKGKIN